MIFLSHKQSAIFWATLIFATLGFFKWEYDKEKAFNSKLSEVPVHMVGGYPDFVSQNVDLAYAAFNIRDSRTLKTVELSPALQARGMTMHGSYGGDADVALGLDAFSSWSLLGSTLAHEVEIHVNQNPFVVWLEDLIFGTGTIRAERAAYSHETLRASRFGLNDSTVRGIEITRDHHYSFLEEPSRFSQFSHRVIDLMHQLTSRVNQFRLTTTFYSESTERKNQDQVKKKKI